MKFTLYRIVFFVSICVFMALPLSCKHDFHPFLVNLPNPPYKREPTILVKTGVSKELTIPENSAFVVRTLSGKILDKGRAKKIKRIGFLGSEYSLDGEILGRDSAFGVKVMSSKGVFVGKVFTEYPVRLVNVNGTSVVVFEIPMEQYIAGVIGAEMPLLWPKEALKAQAIAARSYALAQIARRSADVPYHVSATTSHQKYELVDKSSSAFLAAKATRGQVLIYHDRILMAFYHSTSGGRTANAESLFNCDSLSPLSSRKAPVKENSPYSSWTYSVTWSAFVNKVLLKKNFSPNGPPTRIMIDRLEDGTVETLELKFKGDSIVLKGKEIRSSLGLSKVRSLWFNMVVTSGKVIISGRGYGHRVGMSQYAAKQMAVEGEECEIILLQFYPGTRIVRLYK